MNEKIIRFTVDETFHKELRSCATLEGFSRREMSIFYRRALEHYLDFLLDREIERDLNSMKQKYGVHRILDGLKMLI